MYDTTYHILSHLWEALTAPLHPDADLYWGFLVCALVIAWFAWHFHLNPTSQPVGQSLRSFARRYFSKKLWWHRSAKVDYLLYFSNILLMPIVFTYVGFSQGPVESLFKHFITPTPLLPSPLPPIWLLLLFTIVFFVVYDLGRFIAHSLQHDIPFFWEFHKVHHSAEVLTPMTAFRVHTLDILIMNWVPTLLTGLTTAVFHHYIDPRIGFFTFFGLHVFVFLFNWIDHLRHWSVWVTYPHPLSNWLISPAHHQLHHSAEPEHWGCNRGYELALWDRLYGTLIVPPSLPPAFRLGLGDGSDGQWHCLSKIYFWPLTQSFKLFKNRGRPNQNPSQKSALSTVNSPVSPPKP